MSRILLAAVGWPDAFVQQNDLFLSSFVLNAGSSGCRGNKPSWRWQVEEPTWSHNSSTVRGRCEHHASPASPHPPQLPKVLLEIAMSASCKHVKNYLPGSADVNPHKFVHQPYSRRTAA